MKLTNFVGLNAEGTTLLQTPRTYLRFSCRSEDGLPEPVSVHGSASSVGTTPEKQHAIVLDVRMSDFPLL